MPVFCTAVSSRTTLLLLADPKPAHPVASFKQPSYLLVAGAPWPSDPQSRRENVPRIKVNVSSGGLNICSQQKGGWCLNINCVWAEKACFCSDKPWCWCAFQGSTLEVFKSPCCWFISAEICSALISAEVGVGMFCWCVWRLHWNKGHRWFPSDLWRWKHQLPFFLLPPISNSSSVCRCCCLTAPRRTCVAWTFSQVVLEFLRPVWVSPTS